MKLLQYLLLYNLLLYTCTIFTNTDTEKKPLLVVLLMVKNEEQAMQKTLQPFIDAGIDSYLILDTGSTDRTVEKTQQLFTKYNISHGYIIEEPFVNFAVSRNYALECAEQLFSNAAFFLMIDAEWYMHNIQGLLEFCTQYLQSEETSFMVPLNMPGQTMMFYVQRLFKPHCNIKFAGAVHETINQGTRAKVPNSIYINYQPSEYGYKKTEHRWKRDRDLLLKEFEENPDNPRTAFYLAQTYDCLGDHNNACYWYKKRCEMPGWEEENFMAHYRLAQVYEHMKQWNNALECYLQAYEVRPTRAEPLVKLAEHYWNTQEFALCYLFAKQSMEIPYPKNDILFIEKTCYDYIRYDILGRVAWYVEMYDLGKSAVIEALKAQPQAKHLLQNLALYEKRE